MTRTRSIEQIRYNIVSGMFSYEDAVVLMTRYDLLMGLLAPLTNTECHTIYQEFKEREKIAE